MESRIIYTLPIELTKVTAVDRNSIAHVNDLAHSIDFDAPEGTLVYAAADGTVIDVKDDSNVGGDNKSFEDQGNYVEIRHDKNEVSEYEHLKFKSARVKIGDRVIMGDVIAEVGNTGWSECPHLHFMVFDDAERYKTRQIRFDVMTQKQLSERVRW